MNTTPKAKAQQVVTEALRKIASTMHGVDIHGNARSKAEALADMIWLHALGGAKREVIGEGAERKVKMIMYKSQPWAVQTLLDRLEGRVLPMAEETIHRPSALNRLKDLAKGKLNIMADKHASGGPPPPKNRDPEA